MNSYLKKKINRLLISKNFKKLYYIYHFFSGGFNSKKIDLSFNQKKDRIEIIQNIINLKNYKSYLEIGTFKDELFKPIKCERKIGVDPVSGGNVRKTSDEFFLENNEKFDIVFIDGLHIYSQVKKDILNSVQCLKPNGIVLVHDCMPDSVGKQAVPRYKMQWNGDVWKAIVDLRQKNNLEIYTCEIDQGIGIITNKKNSSVLKLDIPINKIKFKDYYNNYKKYMRVISINEFKEIF